MRFLVVDGIDGSGKNSVAHWTAEWYQAKGLRAQIWTHPSERLTGRISRHALQSEGKLMRTVASVFYMADVITDVGRLRRHQEEDEVIIFVRYLMGTAYLPRCMMRFGYDFFCKLLPVPKALLLCDIDPKLALARIEGRQDAKEMFESIEGLTKARQKTLDLADERWTILDNCGSAECSKNTVYDILHRWEEEGVTVW